MRRTVLPLLVLAACGGDWATGPGGAPDQFEFTAHETTLPTAPVVTASARQLVVDGAIGTPTPCYEAAARVARANAALTVTVTAHGSGSGPCLDVQGSLSYHLVVARLSPGTYQLLVRHALADQLPIDTVLQQAVTVP